METNSFRDLLDGIKWKDTNRRHQKNIGTIAANRGALMEYKR